MPALSDECSVTERFSDRVDHYVKYRPSYPAALIEFLRKNSEVSRVADIGAGTGILTKLLLEAGSEVWAVEPNAPMRAACERAHSGNSRLHSVATKAEATGLLDGSVTLVTAAQAFHWFDREACRREFRRILVPQGQVALIWNSPRIDSDFARGYEKIKEDFGTDFRKVRDTSMKDMEGLADFFQDGFALHEFENFQELDEAGFIGRFFSSSYSPPENSPLREPAAAAAGALFRQFSRAGKVRMDYTTLLYLGKT